MKVVNIEFYRRKREIANLENRMVELVNNSQSAREIKSCFKEWLKRTGTLQ